MSAKYKKLNRSNDFFFIFKTYKETKTPIRANEIFVDRELGVWMVGDRGIVRAGNTKSPISFVSSIKIQKGKFSKLGKELFILDEEKIYSYEGKEKTPIIDRGLVSERNRTQMLKRYSAE